MQAKSIVRTLLGASAVALVSAAAMAVTGFVSPGGAITATGTFGATKGTTTISCTVVFHANSSIAPFTVPPAVNVGTVTSASFTPGPSPLCVSLSSIGMPWTVQATTMTYGSSSFPTPATSLNMTVKGVRVNDPSIGDCLGDVNATFDPATNKITIPATPMAGVNPVTPCHIHGPGTSDNNNPIVLTVTPAQAVTVTAP